MTSALPNLDDRRWDDLVAEARALIPRNAPGWTDHNAHDPGITLLELLAWLTEGNAYRLNRVPNRHRAKFLTLLGAPSNGVAAAELVLQVTPRIAVNPFVLPAGVELSFPSIANTEDHSVSVRTLDSSVVSNIRLAALQVEEGGICSDRTDRLSAGLPVAPFGCVPEPNNAAYFGFAGLPNETRVRLFVKCSDERSGRGERQELVREAIAQAMACRPVLPDIRCAGFSEIRIPHGLPPHHSIALGWELWTGSWSRMKETIPSTRANIPGEIADDTRALTLDGSIEFNVPSTAKPVALGGVAEPLIYVRARIVSGQYDAPPCLAGVALPAIHAVQALPALQKFEILSDVDPAGPVPTPGTIAKLQVSFEETGEISALVFLDQNGTTPGIRVWSYEKTAGDTGSIVLEMQLAGIGSGRPEQQVSLADRPVLATTVNIWTTDGVDWQQWQLRPDFDASTRTDFHFILDDQTGTITFGDGEAGRCVDTGLSILTSYSATLGSAGNIGAAGATGLVDRPINRELLSPLDPGLRAALPNFITVPWEASGGADDEPLDGAIGRAFAVQHAHERLTQFAASARVSTLDDADPSQVAELPIPSQAVDLLDFERLALATPGTRVRRARAWRDVHPDYPCLRAPGHLTVLIVPDMPGPRPIPSPGLLQSVRRFLDRRRLVGTAVHVTSPIWIEVTCSMRIKVQPTAGTMEVEASVRVMLERFLDARIGGPRGFGWPFGRTVRATELMAMIQIIPGVDYVDELRLTAEGRPPVCSAIDLCPTDLVSGGQHEIVVI